MIKKVVKYQVKWKNSDIITWENKNKKILKQGI